MRPPRRLRIAAVDSDFRLLTVTSSDVRLSRMNEPLREKESKQKGQNSDISYYHPASLVIRIHDDRFANFDVLCANHVMGTVRR